MFPEADLFVEGERQLGRYTVRIARYSSTGDWSPTIPPLDVLVTNRRLFLRPQVRKAYPPASIPKSYIRHIKWVDLGPRPGLVMRLKTEHLIYMFIDKEQGENLIDDISAMRAPVPRFHFDNSVVERDIQRLIDFINSL